MYPVKGGLIATGTASLPGYPTGMKMSPGLSLPSLAHRVKETAGKKCDNSLQNAGEAAMLAFTRPQEGQAELKLPTDTTVRND
jgi:hypothetical protein